MPGKQAMLAPAYYSNSYPPKDLSSSDDVHVIVQLPNGQPSCKAAFVTSAPMLN